MSQVITLQDEFLKTYPAASEESFKHRFNDQMFELIQCMTFHQNSLSGEASFLEIAFKGGEIAIDDFVNQYTPLGRRFHRAQFVNHKLQSLFGVPE